MTFLVLDTEPDPTETSSKWLPSVFGVWQDAGNDFTAYLPDVDDEVFHYGPTRLWTKPVQTDSYGESQIFDFHNFNKFCVSENKNKKA